MGEIAASATGHQNFLARLVGVIEYDNPATAPGSRQGAHQTGCAGADNNYIRCLQNLNPSPIGSGHFQQFDEQRIVLSR